MKRREFLIVPLACAGGIAMADLPKVQSLDDSLRWLDRLEGAAGVKAIGAWPMAAVLEHLAQSIEMSMDGYPQSKSRCSRVRRAAPPLPISSGAVACSHDLAEPIPGAPALDRGSRLEARRAAPAPSRHALQRLQRRTPAALRLRAPQQGGIRAGAQPAHRQPPGRDPGGVDRRPQNKSSVPGCGAGSATRSGLLRRVGLRQLAHPHTQQPQPPAQVDPLEALAGDAGGWSCRRP